MNLTPLDPDYDPPFIDVSAARGYQMPKPLMVIDGILPVGYTVVYGAPKCGKTTLVAGWVNWLALGLDLGGTAGAGAGRVLVIDFENTMLDTVDMSWRYASPGTLPGDEAGQVIENMDGPLVVIYRFDEIYGTHDFDTRMAALEKILNDAEARGMPFRLVVIDTLYKFTGEPPQEMISYQWEAKTGGAIDQLALKFRTSHLGIHHTNKKGEISGSTGIIASARAAYRMDSNPAQCEGLLYCHGIRGAAPVHRKLAYTSRGTWEITDALTAVQLLSGGTRRKVADYLAGHAATTAAKITADLGLGREAVKTALRRMHEAQQVAYDVEKRWYLTEAVPDAPPLPDTAVPRVVSLCEVCGDPMDVLEARQTSHPGCEEEPEPVSRETPAGFNAYKCMEETLRSSRLHPLWFIPVEEREAEPWTDRVGAAARASQSARYGHRWKRADIEDFGDREHLVMDRHQSYPGSCNGVPVAPNKLLHTGAIEEDPKALKLAGICEVMVPDWPHVSRIGHPLGKKASAGDRLWVPSGQVELLWKLHEAGHIARPYVTDSWLGRRTTGLFNDYQAAVRDARKAATTGEETESVKFNSSVAIRKLHPKAAKSQWYRPDWFAAIAGESSTRLWVKAWASVQGGADLAWMANTDAVAWIVPAGAPGDWLPPGYELGNDPGTYHVVEKS